MSVKLLRWGNAPGTRLAAGNGGTVFVTDVSSPFDSTVGIRFLTDGTVEITESTDGAVTWQSHGRWIIPTEAATSNYSVRYTNRVGTQDFTSKDAAEDTFIAIAGTRTWLWNETASIDDSFTCDFEVRDDSGLLLPAEAGYEFSITQL